MRPVRLEAEGFTAFRDRITVDFGDTEFFAFVGPTGSGKSSVLDAMYFALYGAVPRYHDAKAVAPAITQGAAEARVSLAFEVQGEEYVATRVVRRTATGASTKEARLERGDEVLAGDSRGMTEAVVQLIGLNFEHFKRCVALPQNEFARFLHDTPGHRQDLLVKLLDLGVYGAMQRQAGQLAAEAKNLIILDEERLADLADCTPEAEAEAKDALGAINAFRKRLTEAAPRFAELEKAVAVAEAEVEAAGHMIALLTAVKVPAGARKLHTKRIEAKKALEDAVHERSKSERALATADKAISGLPDVGTLQAKLEALADLDDVRAEVDELAVAAAAQHEPIEALETDLDVAEAAAHEAKHAYEAARDTAGASALIGALAVGDPCPVCEQVVTKLPKRRPGDEAKAQKQLEAAEKNAASVRATLEKARNLADRAEAQHEAASKRLATLEKKAGKADRKDIERRLADVTKKRLARDAADAAFKAALQRERDAQGALADIEETVADAARGFQQQRDPIVAAGLHAPATANDLLDDWDALASWAQDELPVQRRRGKDAEKAVRTRSAEIAEHLGALVEEAEALGVEFEHEELALDELREAVVAVEVQAKHELDRIVAGRKEAAKLEKQISATREEAEVATELASLLRSNNFEKWLINEVLQRLVVAASDTLEKLSGNQYALAVNERNEFEVIDHRNADERRSAKTLSGGETFQASLALALALAEQVASLAVGGAARLDAIFLDEGFGTLDPDALSTVAATLENLGSNGRMVGLITHVRELAEMVPTRFEVAKNARTSTVTRVDS